MQVLERGGLVHLGGDELVVDAEVPQLRRDSQGLRLGVGVLKPPRIRDYACVETGCLVRCRSSSHPPDKAIDEFGSRRRLGIDEI
jgi:hypothetical protein